MKYLYSILSCVFMVATVQAADTFELKLVDELDESEFYCLDVSGWGNHLKIEDPLQVHTCKPGSSDQQFVVDGSTLKMPEYDRCLAASASGDKALPGSAVMVRECDGSPMQKFELTSSGQIVMNGSDLCVAAGTESLEASGPSHLWRVASLQYCENFEAKLITWKAE
ncbi:RICIN domain-containing protein [Marinomonas sp. 5E14-1]|uniref:RICIN domain-containing protein n=1 Tax=Marinomonas sp. 5E14-1 TaxID=3153922 RepID=UPI003262DBDC